MVCYVGGSFDSALERRDLLPRRLGVLYYALTLGVLYYALTQFVGFFMRSELVHHSKVSSVTFGRSVWGSLTSLLPQSYCGSSTVLTCW